MWFFNNQFKYTNIFKTALIYEKLMTFNQTHNNHTISVNKKAHVWHVT